MATKEEKLLWSKQKSILKRKFVFLTDKDLKFEDGKKDLMFAKLQKRLGKTREELLEIIAAH